MNNFINEKWKDIAKSHTAFCILGGPSSNQVKNINKIIENNFTITVNHNIKRFPHSSLYITADNFIAREYFEENEFFVHQFEGGKLLQNQSNFRYNPSPIWIKGKREILLQNPNLIKIIACSDFPCYNSSFTTGQVYKYKGVEYCKQVSNTHLCVEYRNEQGESHPTLSPSIPETLEKYGTNPSKLYPGGNVASILFQVLWYMGFDKIIIVGYGDKGKSEGYENTEYENDSQNFIWSEPEIHSLVSHHKIWKDRIKILHGGELCREYAPFSNATYDDLESTPNKKKKLINKLLKL
tara:strand:- start:1473 stop:2357 length:885 start_codon:yes stop_codon:yes gene_type:complete